jgi:hypothetical protein
MNDAKSFELVRKITDHKDGNTLQWGPTFYVSTKHEAIQQIWNDIERLIHSDIDGDKQFKMSFDTNDITASYTFVELGRPSTITWRLEPRN